MTVAEFSEFDPRQYKFRGRAAERLQLSSKAGDEKSFHHKL